MARRSLGPGLGVILVVGLLTVISIHMCPRSHSTGRKVIVSVSGGSVYIKNTSARTPMENVGVYVTVGNPYGLTRGFRYPVRLTIGPGRTEEFDFALFNLEESLEAKSGRVLGGSVRLSSIASGTTVAVNIEATVGGDQWMDTFCFTMP